MPLFAVGNAAWTPAQLDLTGWWKDYSGIPWAGSASLGTSASNSFTSSTGTVIVGASSNGHASLDLGGTTAKISAAAVSNFITGSQYSGWVLYQTDNTTAVADCLIGANTANSISANPFDVYGAGSNVNFALADTTSSKVLTGPARAGIGTYMLIQYRFTGGTMSIRRNGDSWITSTTALTSSPLTSALRIGVAPSATNGAASPASLDGRILEAGISKTAIVNADFDKLLAYARIRYALAL